MISAPPPQPAARGLAVCAALFLLVVSGCQLPTRPRIATAPSREFWLDLARAEIVAEAAVLDDLARANVIYLGETHTVARHHALQLRLLQTLFARSLPLVLCLEPLEATDQPAIDRYNRREIDFPTLAREIDWPTKWGNYADYRALCDFARQHGIPVRGLNAPADLIRAVNRGGGVALLTPAQRAQLPADLVLDDPIYERVTTLMLASHAAVDPAKLRPMFEAQLARDETMAANIVAARRGSASPPRIAVVILGSGHMRYGLGTAASVRRRAPGIVERLVLFTEGGELQLALAEQRESGEGPASHADFRAVGRLPADYLNVLPPRPASHTPLPAGHPAIR